MTMTVCELAEQIVEKYEQEMKIEKAYFADKNGEYGKTMQDAVTASLKHRQNLEELITWSAGPHSLREVIVLASITVCRLDMLQNTLDNVDLEGEKTAQNDLAAAIRMTDNILAAVEHETGISREELGIAHLRPRLLDTNTLQDRANTEANKILAATKKTDNRPVRDKAA